MKVQEYTVNNIGVAVDVGSTTIGVCCVDLEHNTEILSFSFANPQHIYGADIVTRIKHCVDDVSILQAMHVLVEEELYTQIKAHLHEKYFSVSTIVYSGNTTMLHIQQELSVNGLAQAPFKPVSLEYADKIIEKNDLNDDFIADVKHTKKYSNIKNIYLPGFSAFVGADILSGAVFLEMGKTEKYDLLIDLGTNGEILLLNKNNGFATSTACGPVFDHVISGARYGSESIRVIANCVKRGLIDKTGKLTDALFEKGIVIDKNLTVKQENVRNFQLAKGAIYAGIQCVLDKANIQSNEVAKVYISGGLGFHMDKGSVFILKMLPEEFKDKIVVSGNTSLEGAKQWLLSTKMEQSDLLREYDSIRKRTESFELANFDGFQDIYMNSLEF